MARWIDRMIATDRGKDILADFEYWRDGRQNKDLAAHVRYSTPNSRGTFAAMLDYASHFRTKEHPNKGAAFERLDRVRKMRTNIQLEPLP